MPHATIRTTFSEAAIVAAAVRPDNTAEMTTDVDGDTIVTTVDRDTSGGLRATATDYIANINVARDVVQTIDRHDNQHS